MALSFNSLHFQVILGIISGSWLMGHGHSGPARPVGRQENHDPGCWGFPSLKIEKFVRFTKVQCHIFDEYSSPSRSRPNVACFCFVFGIFLLAPSKLLSPSKHTIQWWYHATIVFTNFLQKQYEHLRICDDKTIGSEGSRFKNTHALKSDKLYSGRLVCLPQVASK